MTPRHTGHDTSQARGDDSRAGPGAVPTPDDDVTMLLLSLAARRRAGPFAPLVARIERPDGGRWFLEAVEGACRTAGLSVAALSAPAQGEAALRQLKSWSKSHLAETLESSGLASHAEEVDDATLRALLGYALAVAMGLGAHGVRLSSRPPREWDPLFVDLSELAPQPWATTFQQAIGR